MELNDLLGVETDLRIPNHYYELSSDEMARSVSEIKSRLGARLFIPGHHYQKDEVIDFETIINEVALLRNKWLGIMKGLESKNFMLGHITRLRTAGMEDASID